MTRIIAASAALSAVLALHAGAVSAADWKVLSEKTVTGFGHVESVGYDPMEKVFYTSDFGPALKPADKDGKGKITKLSLDGKVLVDRYLPPPGTTMDKPKGIWIAGRHLWVTDIDSVWEFDLASKEARKLPLPGVTFANDPTIIGDALYVSDNRSDKLVRVEPAEFLTVKSPEITEVFAGKGVNPNGLAPAADGSLLMVGFASKDSPRGIWSMKPGGEPKQISDPIGRLDGVYQAGDGTLLVTDWNSGSLFAWSESGGKRELATGFKGPADLAVAPNDQGLLVAVPDLVKGEIRLIQLGH